MKSFFLAATLFSFSAVAQTPTSQQTVENSIDTLLDISSRITFSTQADQTNYYNVIRSLQLVSKQLAVSDSAEIAKLDAIITKIQALQKVITSYFGKKDIFGYELAKGPINLQLDAGIAYTQIFSKLPFLSGITASGSLTVNPGAQIEKQLNALISEFTSELINAAALSKSDLRLCNAAKWANDTEYRTAGNSFGTPVLETNQLWNLKLSCN